MTGPPSAPLRVGAGAHQGKVREENQDRISRFHSPFGEIFVVADGIGGYQGGAQAAEMVIHGLETHLRAMPAGTAPADALQEAARRTNAEVYRRAHSGDPATANMGATGVLALVAGRSVRLAHAGDCRAYLLRGGELSRRTRDHTRIQAMLDKNLLSPEEAKDHPDASVVTRAFGKEADLVLEVSEPFELQDGDLLLLASDGLCGYVEDSAIRAALLLGGDAQDIANRLIGLALEAGGEDNVSVQVLLAAGGSARAVAPPLPVAAPPAVAPAPLPRAAPRRPFSWGIVALLLILAFLAGWVFSGRPSTDDDKPEVKPSVEKEENAQRERPTDPKRPTKPQEEAQPEEETAPPEDEAEQDSTETYRSDAPATGDARPRTLILGEDPTEPLRRLLGDLVPQVLPGSGARPQGFPRGWVYFRDRRHQKEAEDISRDLSRGAKRNRRYHAKPWPKDLAGLFRDVEILIVPWSPTGKTETP